MIGGLILAAGAATRFGSPKQLAELGGRPLLQHAVDAMLAVEGLDRVVVVLGHAAARIRAEVEFGSAQAIACERFSDGMAASLRCGVDALHDCDRIVITLGDQPLITPEAIAAVLSACGGGVLAARAVYHGVDGHPVALARELLDRIGELSGDAGFRDLLGRTEVRTVEAGHLAHPDDIDTPEELELIRP